MHAPKQIMTSVLRLHASANATALTWPESLGRLSTAAARAVRSAPANATSVVFPASDGEQRNLLLALPNGRVVVEASDAAAYYEERATADHEAGRRLAGRHGPGLPNEEPLQGSMGGFYTCAAHARTHAAHARARASAPTVHTVHAS